MNEKAKSKNKNPEKTTAETIGHVEAWCMLAKMAGSFGISSAVKDTVG